MHVTFTACPASGVHQVAASPEALQRANPPAKIAFLGINGRRLTLTNDEAYHLVIEVAAGRQGGEVGELTDASKRGYCSSASKAWSEAPSRGRSVSVGDLDPQWATSQSQVSSACVRRSSPAADLLRMVDRFPGWCAD